jgi:hypothetical protein
MTYVTPSGEQYVVVTAGGHRELRDKAGDYIVAFALRGVARGKPPAAPLASARYDGHVILDRSRLPLRVDLAVNGSAATMTFDASNPHVEGNGKEYLDGLFGPPSQARHVRRLQVKTRTRATRSRGAATARVRVEG